MLQVQLKSARRYVAPVFACVCLVACQAELHDEHQGADLVDLMDASSSDMEQAHDLGSDIFEPGDMVTPDAEDMVLDLAALDMGSEPDLPDSPPDLSEDPGSPIEQAQPFAEGMPAWGDRAIDIGAGKEVLVESLQGDVHRWETGPQGGYHLWVGSSFDATLIEALSDEELATFTILYRVWRQDGTLLASTQRLGGLTRDEEGRWVSIGQYAVLEAPIRPRRMDGELLLFRVDVSLPHESEARHRAVWITSQCCD